MTTSDHTTAIDLNSLDAVIAAHLQAYGRAVDDPAEKFWSEDNPEIGSLASSTAYGLFFSDDTPASQKFAYSVFTKGFQLALELANLVSRSPFRPDENAIGEHVRNTRDWLAQHFHNAYDVQQLNPGGQPEAEA